MVEGLSQVIFSDIFVISFSTVIGEKEKESTSALSAVGHFFTMFIGQLV